MDMTTLFIFEPPYVYFILIAVVVGIGLVVFKKVKMDKKEVTFKGQTIEEVAIEDNIKPFMKVSGQRVKKGKLINGMNILNVCEYATVKIKTVVDGEETVKHNLIIFRAGSYSRIPIVRKFKSKKDFFLIENSDDVVIKDPVANNWNLNSNVHLYMLGGVWVSGEMGKHYISEMIFKKIFENLKEEDMNYPKRVVWYDTGAAAHMTATEQEYDLEDRKWGRRAEGETGNVPPPKK